MSQKAWQLQVHLAEELSTGPACSTVLLMAAGREVTRGRRTLAPDPGRLRCGQARLDKVPTGG